MQHIRLATITLFAISSSVAFGDDASSQADAQRSRREPDQRRSSGDANAARTMQRWQAMDKDGDRKLSRDEAEGQIESNFGRIDANKDGFIEQAELDALSKRLFSNRNGQANGNRNQQTMSTEQLLRRAPEGVTIIPDVAYREGHARWKLDLAMPADPARTLRPAIVFVHGGGWRNGDKRKANFLNPMLDFAADGYVCITVNYRFLSDVSMMECISDVKCAVRWLRAHAEQYHVDPQRIGATGNSAGAHLSAMLGVCPPSAGLEGDGPWQEQSSMVQAVCCSATPTSFLMPMNDRQRQAQKSPEPGQDADGPEPENNQTDVRARKAQPNSAYTLTEKFRQQVSPMTYVSADAPPFLMVHESSDRTVSIRHTEKFVQALREAGADDVTFMRYEDGSGHGAFQANIKETGPARKAFFDRILRPEVAQKNVDEGYSNHTPSRESKTTGRD